MIADRAAYDVPYRYRQLTVTAVVSMSIYLLITLSTPLRLLTSALFLATTSRHVLYAPPTPICCRFLVSTQRLLPAVSALLPPQCGTNSLLAFALVLQHILPVVFLKPTVLIRPSVPHSGSHKCLRVGLWSTLRTLKDFIYLLTYLLYLEFQS